MFKDPLTSSTLQILVNFECKWLPDASNTECGGLGRAGGEASTDNFKDDGRLFQR